MQLLIGGDFYVADKIIGRSLISKTVSNLFNQADYCIVNLESPITAYNAANKIIKTGPHLRTSAKTVLPVLKQLNVNLVTLANNHIMDYGFGGLNDTFTSLKEQNVNFVGAGKDIFEAKNPFILEKNEMQVAILNFAEKEWSIAGYNSPGANPLDVIDNVNQIRAAKKQYDKVICIIHGGHEYYQLPSPRMVKQYRFYAENGADAIIGHHTHCFSGFEVYNDVPIFYSLGNFLFTKRNSNESWYTGLLLELNIKAKMAIEFKIHPIRQEKETFQVDVLKDQNKLVVLEELSSLNRIISDIELVTEKWEQYVNANKSSYLVKLSPLMGVRNRFIRFFLLRIGLNKLILNSKFLMFLLVFMKCESHYEFSIKSIEIKLESSK